MKKLLHQKLMRMNNGEDVFIMKSTLSPWSNKRYGIIGRW